METKINFIDTPETTTDLEAAIKVAHEFNIREVAAQASYNSASQPLRAQVISPVGGKAEWRVEAHHPVRGFVSYIDPHAFDARIERERAFDEFFPKPWSK